MIYVAVQDIENPGNLGAIARAMANFDFSNLLLISPKCRKNDKEAVRRAKHGAGILGNARLVKWSDIRKFDYVVGTTAKVGTDYNISRSPVTPNQLAQKLRSIGAESRVVIIIGREGKGLSNREIQQCDFVVTIPASKEYPTMNVSHSLAVILYEIFNASSDTHVGHFLPATKKEKEVTMKYVNAILKGMDFRTCGERETQVKVWKRILGKSFMTKREIFALIGFLRKIKKI